LLHNGIREIATFSEEKSTPFEGEKEERFSTVRAKFEGMAKSGTETKNVDPER
jgi:hypothetical protein